MTVRTGADSNVLIADIQWGWTGALTGSGLLSVFFLFQRRGRSRVILRLVKEIEFARGNGRTINDVVCKLKTRKDSTERLLRKYVQRATKPPA